MDKNFRDMCAIMAMQALVSRDPRAAMAAEQTAVIAFDIAKAMAAERDRRDELAAMKRESRAPMPPGHSRDWMR